jgi:hypothetical protein
MNTRRRICTGIGTVGVTVATCALVGIGGIASAAAATPTVASTPTGTSSAAPGTASSDLRLAAIKARAAAAISRRHTSLVANIAGVSANTVINATDKATLLATLNNDLSGLTALGGKIAADTTVAQASADYQTIFTTYRVYALALPQVRYAAATDDITGGVLPRLTDADTKLAALLMGVDSDKDTPAVQAAMTDLGTQITAATSATNGLSASVLALTPAQYDANHALLSGPRATLAGASKDVRAARADVATVMAALANVSSSASSSAGSSASVTE